MQSTMLYKLWVLLLYSKEHTDHRPRKIHTLIALTEFKKIQHTLKSRKTLNNFSLRLFEEKNSELN